MQLWFIVRLTSYCTVHICMDSRVCACCCGCSKSLNWQTLDCKRCICRVFSLKKPMSKYITLQINLNKSFNLPECTRIWSIKLDDWINDLPHTAHTYGFSPVCVRTCVVSVDECVKRLSQIGQACGFSVLCTFKCELRRRESMKPFPHTLHTQGRSPVCVREWTLNACES